MLLRLSPPRCPALRSNVPLSIPLNEVSGLGARSILSLSGFTRGATTRSLRSTVPRDGSTALLSKLLVGNPRVSGLAGDTRGALAPKRSLVLVSL
jgi:hypothetical protein